MSEYQLKLNGWQAIAGLVVLAGLLAVRLMTFNDMKGDVSLMEKIDLQLTSAYFPEDVERLRLAVESGDRETSAKVAESVTSRRVNISSVQTSYPLFSFTSNREVVVKVIYSLDDASGTGDTETKYYLFRHGTLGNAWQYKYDSSALMYYLNFI